MVEGFVIFARYIIISGLLSHVVGYFLPRHVLNYDSFPYKSFKWECNGDYYNRFNIARWKKKVPDMSKVMRFIYPKALTYPVTSVQIDRLIRETCVAEFIHILLIALSPVLGRFIDGRIGVFYVVCSILGNIPYIMIQRYNRPKLIHLYNSLCVKEKKQASEELQNESVNIVM